LAAISVPRIGVIASFASGLIEDPIATGFVGRTRCIASVAAHRIAVVANFRGVANVVPACWKLAIALATISVDGIAVVTRFSRRGIECSVSACFVR
jgi:hypothetical protein